MSETSISSCTAYYTGGAIEAKESTLELKDSVFEGNLAGREYGGAIYLSNFGNLYGNNISVRNNEANSHGGGICTTEDVYAELENSHFDNNVAQNGGGLAYTAGSETHLHKIRFTNNHAHSFGGAVFIKYTGKQSTFSDCTFEGNNANYGAGMSGASANVEISNTSFLTNVAEEYGGAMDLVNVTITLQHSVLESNEAVQDGGGIAAISGSRLTLSDMLIDSNKAGYNGGGIAVSLGASLLCYSCNFLRNEADYGAGLHLPTEESPLVVAQLQNSTFEENSAFFYGGKNLSLIYRSEHACFQEVLAFKLQKMEQ